MKLDPQFVGVTLSAFREMEFREITSVIDSLPTIPDPTEDQSEWLRLVRDAVENPIEPQDMSFRHIAGLCLQALATRRLREMYS